MAQSVEHVIGNDEVISSILITSSKKSKSQDLLFFLFSFTKIYFIFANAFPALDNAVKVCYNMMVIKNQ